jgi:hypothetical protein
MSDVFISYARSTEAQARCACALVAHLNDKDASLDLLGPALAHATADRLNYAKVDPDLDRISEDDPPFVTMIAAAEARLAAAGRIAGGLER